MEQIYEVFWEGLEHRVILDRSKFNPSIRPGPDNFFWGVENLPMEVVGAIYQNQPMEGLKYEKKDK